MNNNMNNNDTNTTATNVNADMVLMMKEEGEKPKKNIWLEDSAASSPIMNSLEEMINMENVSTHVKFGNGEYIYRQNWRTKKIMITASNGEKTPIKVTNILYIPEM